MVNIIDLLNGIVFINSDVGPVAQIGASDPKAPDRYFSLIVYTAVRDGASKLTLTPESSISPIKYSIGNADFDLYIPPPQDYGEVIRKLARFIGGPVIPVADDHAVYSGFVCLGTYKIFVHVNQVNKVDHRSIDILLEYSDDCRSEALRYDRELMKRHEI